MDAEGATFLSTAGVPLLESSGCEQSRAENNPITNEVRKRRTVALSVSEETIALKGDILAPFKISGEWASGEDRIGVPGHGAYEYNGNLFKSLAPLFSKVMFHSFFCKFQIMFAICVGIFYTFVPYNEYTRALKNPPYVSAVFKSLCVFALTFYVGNIFGKWHTRFENVCKTNGNMTRLSALACATFSKSEAHTILRYANSILHMYYFMMSEGGMNERRWGQLVSRGMLTEDEVAQLGIHGSPAVVLYSWSAQMINELSQNREHSIPIERAMEESIGGVRGLAAKQIAYTLTQTPYIYYSAITFLVNVYGICLSIDGFGKSYFEAVNRNCDQIESEAGKFTTSGEPCVPLICFAIYGHLAVLLAFAILFNSAVYLAECYGPNSSHYDLGNDLDNLWNESKNLLRSMEIPRPNKCEAIAI